MNEEKKRVPTCRECKYSRPFLFYDYSLGKCKAPQSFSHYDVVTGKTSQRWEYCSVYRTSGDDVCGRTEARWFEPRRPLWQRLLERLAA